MGLGVPPPLSRLPSGPPLPLAAPRWAAGSCKAPSVLLYSCSRFHALIESSLEEELNRVRGGMLVMPDLLFGVSFFGGRPSLCRGRALANWVLTVASLRGYSRWGSCPFVVVTERQAAGVGGMGPGPPGLGGSSPGSLSPPFLPLLVPLPHLGVLWSH